MALFNVTSRFTSAEERDPQLRTLARYAEMCEKEGILKELNVDKSERGIEIEIIFTHIDPKYKFDDIGEACLFFQLMALTHRAGREAAQESLDRQVISETPSESR